MEEQCKKCSKCKENVKFSQFYRDKSQKDGLCSSCKKCKNAKIITFREKRAETRISIPLEQICPRCKIKRSSDCFFKNKSTVTGLNIYCKPCISEKRIERKQHVLQNPIVIQEDITKKCLRCNIVKNLHHFKITRKSNDNFTNVCMDCLPKNTWTLEKQREYEKKYRMNNPEKVKEKYRKQELNVNRRIRKRLNSRIMEALLTSSQRKRKKTIEYIGCNIDFFRNWISSQFQEGMSWENHGQWHLDHVKPCSSFDLSNCDEIQRCFCWKNMQPLWASDNLTKSGRIDNSLIEKHSEKADNYEKIHLST